MPNLLTDTEIVDQLAALVAQPTEVVSVQPGFEPWIDVVKSVDGFWRGIINGLLQRRQKVRQPGIQQPPLPPGQRCVRCDAKLDQHFHGASFYGGSWYCLSCLMLGNEHGR